MKSMRCIALLAVAGIATVASARPVDGANVQTRIFNDDADSNLTVVNNYPSLISIADANVNGDGVGGEFANRHNFRLSSGGVDAEFANSQSFSFSTNVRIDGPGAAEGGLNVSPWWSKEIDGNFMLNTGNNEVAIFGGRLPFFSFTATHGVKYFAGQTVRLGVNYSANSLSAGDPGTIEYTYFDGVNTYSSGVLAFDMGNPAEDPPHGLWGLLNDYTVGGYYMPFVDSFVPDPSSSITFSDLSYTAVPAPASAVLMGMAGIVASRRRR
jgi:hypothetical protein